MFPTRFTIRVYGILINRDKQVLISHEQIGDFAFTKFPGGGLEFGEGPKECLVREFKEETGIDVIVHRHLYTCDFFVQSQLDPEEQVIGIYYFVKAADETQLKNIALLPSMQEFRGRGNLITHEWLHIEEMKTEMLTFEIDKRAFVLISKSIH